MRYGFLILFFFALGSSKAAFDKKAYFACMYTTDVAFIDQQLRSVQSLSGVEKDAYEGAMLMKKAEVVPNKLTKLELFKEGKAKLEAAILKNAHSIEFRILRLIIQEHAPGFLGYNKSLQDDAKFIKSHFPSCTEVLKKIIQDYSKTSQYLKL